MSITEQTAHRPLGKLIWRKARWGMDYILKRWFNVFGWRDYVVSTRAISPSGRASGAGRLFVDVSVISQHDAATGIQRVVRAVANQLATRYKGRQLHFVHTYQKRHYVARLQDEGFSKTTEPVFYTAGDTFLGLDFSLDALWQMRGELQQMRRIGVRFWYLVHDFLPYTRPEWFSEPTVLRFRNWLAIMAGTADGFFCVSPSVGRQIKDIMIHEFGAGPEIAVEVIPLGWDVSNSRPSTGLPAGFDRVLSQIQNAPSILVVGTIEPRKGHRDALRAMEELWRRGSKVRLVLVGGAGWKMADFVSDLASHRDAGSRLLWVGKVSDEALALLYDACTGVLVPSLGEGFGLPLIEALGHGKPVLARRLEVFETHGYKGLTFFDDGLDHTELASTIASWVEGCDDREVVQPDLLPKWADTADFIIARLRPGRLSPPLDRSGKHKSDGIIELDPGK